MEEIKVKMIRMANEAQRDTSTHQQNIKSFINLYKQSLFEEFTRAFTYLLELLSITDATKNKNVQKCRDFTVNCVVALIEPKNSSYDEVSTHPFLRNVLHSTLEMAQINDTHKKYFSCCFIKSLLQSMSADSNLDNDICDSIQDEMLKLSEEGRSEIREQAMHALHRLQDPSNKDCPVIETYVKHLEDVNWCVRKAAVEKIAPTQVTVLKIVDSVEDVNPKVRVATFIKCSLINPRIFKISSRQKLCLHGFRDKDRFVNKTFYNVFLPKWLSLYEGNFLKFLNLMKLDADEADVENTSTLCDFIMIELFRHYTVIDLIQNLPLDDNKLIPVDKLSSEVAMFWSTIHRRITMIEDNDDLLNAVVPECVVFCSYIENVIKEKNKQESELWEHLEYETTLKLLFQIVSRFDLSDEAGRQALKKLVLNTLTNTKLCCTKTVAVLLDILKKICMDINEVTTEVINIIMNIKEPLLDVEEKITSLQLQERDYQLASLNVKIDVITDELDQAVADREYNIAAEKKEKLNELVEEKERLIRLFEAPKQVRCELQDAATKGRCVDILNGLLALPELKKTTPLLKTFKVEFLDSLNNSHDIELVRKVRKCVILYSLLEHDTAVDLFEGICSPIVYYGKLPDFDRPSLVTAINGFSDLVMVHGPSLFLQSSSDAESGNSRRKLYDSGEIDVFKPDKKEFSLPSLINALFPMLDEECFEIQGAAGIVLAKFLYDGICVTPVFLARIMVKWANPVLKQTNNKLFRVFGSAIYAYVKKFQCSAEILEKAIMITLNILANAPKTSPLIDVKLDVLFELFFMLMTSTRQKCVDLQKTLACTLCSEINNKEDDVCVPLWSKFLSSLNISHFDKTTLMELKIQVQNMLENNDAKIYKARIRKFLGQIIKTLEVIDSETQLPDIAEENADLPENAINNSTIESASNENRIIVTEALIHVSEEVKRDRRSKRMKLDHETANGNILPDGGIQVLQNIQVNNHDADGIIKDKQRKRENNKLLRKPVRLRSKRVRMQKNAVLNKTESDMTETDGELSKTQNVPSTTENARQIRNHVVAPTDSDTEHDKTVTKSAENSDVTDAENNENDKSAVNSDATNGENDKTATKSAENSDVTDAENNVRILKSQVNKELPKRRIRNHPDLNETENNEKVLKSPQKESSTNKEPARNLSRSRSRTNLNVTENSEQVSKSPQKDSSKDKELPKRRIRNRADLNETENSERDSKSPQKESSANKELPKRNLRQNRSRTNLNVTENNERVLKSPQKESSRNKEPTRESRNHTNLNETENSDSPQKESSTNKELPKRRIRNREDFNNERSRNKELTRNLRLRRSHTNLNLNGKENNERALKSPQKEPSRNKELPRRQSRNRADLNETESNEQVSKSPQKESPRNKELPKRQIGTENSKRVLKSPQKESLRNREPRNSSQSQSRTNLNETESNERVLRSPQKESSKSKELTTRQTRNHPDSNETVTKSSRNKIAQTSKSPQNSSRFNNITNSNNNEKSLKPPQKEPLKNKAVSTKNLRNRSFTTNDSPQTKNNERVAKSQKALTENSKASKQLQKELFKIKQESAKSIQQMRRSIFTIPSRRNENAPANKQKNDDQENTNEHYRETRSRNARRSLGSVQNVLRATKSASELEVAVPQKKVQKDNVASAGRRVSSRNGKTDNNRTTQNTEGSKKRITLILSEVSNKKSSDELNTSLRSNNSMISNAEPRTPKTKSKRTRMNVDMSSNEDIQIKKPAKRLNQGNVRENGKTEARTLRKRKETRSVTKNKRKVK